MQGDELQNLKLQVAYLEKAVGKLTQRVYTLETQQKHDVQPTTLQNNCNHTISEDEDLANSLLYTDKLPSPPPIPPEPPVVKKPGWEIQLGRVILNRLGIIIILLALGYFFKLSIENNWITPLMRIITGSLLGLAFLGGGEFYRHRSPKFGYSLTGGGIGILYFTVYAAYNFYHLCSYTTAFALTLFMTLGSVSLSLAYNNSVIAVLAALGGFLSPLVLSTGNANLTGLFSYMLILNIGMLWLAHVRKWPVVAWVCFIMTTLVTAGMSQHSLSWTVFFFSTAYFCIFLLYSLFYKPHAESQRHVSWLEACNSVTYFATAITTLSHLGQYPKLVFVPLFVLSVILVGCYTRHYLTTVVSLSPVYTVYMSLLFARLTLDNSVLLSLSLVFVLIFGFSMITLRQSSPKSAVTILLLLNSLLYLALGHALLEKMHLEGSGLFALVLAVLHILFLLIGRKLAFNTTTLTCLAGLSIILLTLAAPLQTSGKWLTIWWEVEGTVLLFLSYRAYPKWVRPTALWIWAMALVSLPGAVPATEKTLLLNARTFLFVMTISQLWLIFYLEARFHDQTSLVTRLKTITFILVNGITLLWLNTELTNYFNNQLLQLKFTMPFDKTELKSLQNANKLSLSLAWTMYGIGLLVAGLVRRYPLSRYLAFVLLGIVLLKVFFVDLASLALLYRIAALGALGAAFLVVSYLYREKKEEQ